MFTNDYQELNFLASTKITLKNLFLNDKNRLESFSIKYKDLYFDFSKQLIDRNIFAKLVDLAVSAELEKKINHLFSGEQLNFTEQRSVLHTALRDLDANIIINNNNVSDAIRTSLTKMELFCNNIHNNKILGYSGKKIINIVNIGIGGSDLGPRLAISALKDYQVHNINVYFISSIDIDGVYDVLKVIDPETTIFIITSKTFSTIETITNANTIKQWFLRSTTDEKNVKKHFIGITANSKKAIEFGILEENIFDFWDFIGGRFSLCSAVGLSIALYIGFANFKKILSGAQAMDNHFKNTTDFTKNIPVVFALISIWNINFLKFSTNVVSPYNTRLSLLPSYIQQLEMESNGKSVDVDGKSIDYNTCPIIWGADGINGQHAYYQLLHQGTSTHPMDIVLFKDAKNKNILHQNILYANAIAQAEAFMKGKSEEEAFNELINLNIDFKEATFLSKFKSFKGNRPTNMLVFEKLDPFNFGMLIALYEHKTFVEGVIWNINSFDQMGVELGKQLANNILLDIKKDERMKHDESTDNLIKICFDE